MSWVAIQATLSRSTSACSSWRSLSASWAALILWPSAIVVFSFACLRDQTDDHEARGGRTHIRLRGLATPLSPTRPKRIVALAHPDEAGLAALASNLNVGSFWSLTPQFHMGWGGGQTR